MVSRLALGMAIAIAGTATVSGRAAAQEGGAIATPSTSESDVDGSSSSGELQDIIVTAEKRGTNMQKTPIAITALSGRALENAHITDLRSLTSAAPSFKAGDAGGYSQVTVRGVGNQAIAPATESAVAINMNEVYLARPSSNLTGLFDIEALEVLRGPQGTLYGRNATAGAVNITTRRPKEKLEGNVSLTGGNYDYLRVEAGVGGSVIEDFLRVRIAGVFERRDGYGKNITTGRDVDFKRDEGIRGTAILQPAPNLEIALIGEHYHEDSDSPFHWFGGTGTLPLPGTIGVAPPGITLGGIMLLNSRDVANDFTSYYNLKTTTLTALAKYQLGAVNITSVTGYRKQKLAVGIDFDGSNLPLGAFISGEPAKQFSQELRANYQMGRFNGTIGAYYFHEKDSSSPSTAALSTELVYPLFGIPRPTPDYLLNFGHFGGTITTTSKAVFAQGSYEVVDGLTVTAGIRYSSDRKRLVSRYGFDVVTPFDPDLPDGPGVPVPARSFHSTTPKFVAQYQIDPKIMVYASYSKGFKAGGFDASVDPTSGFTGFEPEKITAYEAGFKSTSMDNRLRLNAAAFYYDYTNLQVSQVVDLGAFATANAASARVWGLESDLTLLPAPGIELSVNGTYLNAKYKKYMGPDPSRPLLPTVDFSGNRLSNAPKWSGIAAAQYTINVASGDLIFRAEGEFSSKYYFDPANLDFNSQSGFFKGNAYATYEFGNGMSLQAYVRNIFDRKTRAATAVQGAIVGASLVGSYAPPRLIGGRIAYRF